jgi:hypothetical protein
MLWGFVALVARKPALRGQSYSSPTRPPAPHPLVIQPHLVRDLAGFDENRIGFRDESVSPVSEGHTYSSQPGLDRPLEDTAEGRVPSAVEWLVILGTTWQVRSENKSVP